MKTGRTERVLVTMAFVSGDADARAFTDWLQAAWRISRRVVGVVADRGRASTPVQSAARARSIGNGPQRFVRGTFGDGVRRARPTAAYDDGRGRYTVTGHCQAEQRRRKARDRDPVGTTWW